MSIFKKFKQLLAAKNSPEETVELLADSINETSQLIIGSDSIHSRSIKRHMRAAEANCKEAFKSMQRDDEKDAVRCAKNGLAHLHIVRVLLRGKEPQTKLEVESGIGTIEGAFNYLINQIAKVKLLVEYGDLQMTTTVQESLLNVMKIFDAAVADMRRRRLSDAKREAGAAMVALHWTVCLLEAHNPNHSFSDLKMPREGASTAEIKACELATKMGEFRGTLGEVKTEAIPDVMLHLQAAEEKFAACLENIIDGDKQSTVLEARAGMLDVQSAMRASQDTADAEDRRQNSDARMKISQFSQDAHRILRLCEHLGIDYRSLERRMQAALDYYVSAHRKLAKNDLAEAERLSRAAHLDLDFSWQLANAVKRAEYRQEL